MVSADTSVRTRVRVGARASVTNEGMERPYDVGNVFG